MNLQPRSEVADPATETFRPFGSSRGGRSHNGILRHPTVMGAILGLLWGVAMRGWMRFISTDPEFSWSGTLFILGAAVIVGSLLGFARHRRARGGIGWWRLSMMSLLLLGAGGAVMWPSVALGAIAFGRARPRWLRPLLAVGALAAQIPVIQGTVLDNSRFTLIEMAIAIAWYLPLLTAEAWGFAVVFQPSLADAPVPGALRKALIVAPVALVVITAVIAVGIPGG